jgi:gluconokinase
MVIILMGVTGAGKTTVGSLLARQLGWEFADADDFHSAANIEKMHQGKALTDTDRAPWLQSLGDRILQWINSGENAVLACSALKEGYRRELSVSDEVKWVYLKGNPEVIRRRVSGRLGHFAGASLLASQIADLEEPSNAIVIDVEETPEEIVARIRTRLGLA